MSPGRGSDQNFLQIHHQQVEEEQDLGQVFSSQNKFIINFSSILSSQFLIYIG